MQNAGPKCPPRLSGAFFLHGWRGIVGAAGHGSADVRGFAGAIHAIAGVFATNRPGVRWMSPPQARRDAPGDAGAGGAWGATRLARRSWCLLSLDAGQPAEEIPHRARLIQMSLCRRLPHAPRPSAALVAHQPRHGRLDLPAAAEQRLSGGRPIEGVLC